MNTKNIAAQLSKKFNDYLDSIKDEQVKKMVKDGAIITGGSIASMLQGDKPKDYDLYFKDKETVLAVAKYYAKLFNNIPRNRTVSIVEDGERVKMWIQSAGVSNDETNEHRDTTMQDIENMDSDDAPEEECREYKPVYITSNAITLSGGIQLVIRFYGNPEQIHENYDFVHCTNYWTSWTKKVVTNTKALEALINKELVYIGSKYPLASMFRIRKFLNRGYHINAGQMLKIGLQISALDMTDPKVIEDQLIGVDTAYFNVIIEAVNSAKEEGKLNTASELNSYIFELVNRLF